MSTQRRQLLRVQGLIETIRPCENTDADLLSRFTRTRDEAAFTELFRRHGRMVLGVCRRVLRHSADAEDAAQATFLVLSRRAGELRDPSRVAPWLYGVAWRVANKLRLTRRETTSLPEGLASHPQADDWPVELDAAIARLPEKYRTPIILCHLQGMSPSDVAGQLGCPQATVATRLFRARRALRRRLQSQGIAIPAALVAGSALQVPQSLAISVPELAAGRTQSIAVAGLADGVFRSTFMMKSFSLATAALLALAGIGVIGFQVGGQEPTRSKDVPASGPPAITEQKPADTVPPPVLVPSAGIVASTPNFRVSAPSARIAKLVVEAAERSRQDLAKLWLGKELPNWPHPCDIQVSIGGASSGATTFQFERDTFTASMAVDGQLDRILADTIPHEVMHCVLADAFRAPVPRWADEGIASLCETAEEQSKHLAFAREVGNAGEFMQIKALLESKSYPSNVKAFYAQSVLITQHLVDRKGIQTLLAFVREGMKQGWEPAAKTHYGYATLQEFEADYLRKLREPVKNSATRNIPHPPLAVVATRDEDGRLTVKYSGSVYVPVTRYVLRERTVEKGNGRGKETYYEPVKSFELAADSRYESQIEKNDYKFVNPDGRTLDEKQLREAFKGQSKTVLLSYDEKGIDRSFANLLKTDTLILIVPARQDARPR